jgi:hypothetical protein
MIFSGCLSAVLLSASAFARPIDERYYPAQENERANTNQREKESTPQIDPRAENVLREMARYMDSLKSFRVETTSVDEKFTQNGRKVQQLAEAQVTVQRPNRVRIDRRGPNGRACLASDGQTVMLVNFDKQVYASLEAPQTLGEMFDLVRDRLKIDAPGADLLADPYDALTDGATEIRYVGLVPVGDKMAHQLFISRPDLDWQVWIEDSLKPVPLRYVLTSKDVQSQPQYTLELHGWDSRVSPRPDTFEVAPPPGAQQIDLSQPAKTRNEQ